MHPSVRQSVNNIDASFSMISSPPACIVGPRSPPSRFDLQIVFSNGKQDPWHGGGIMANVSDTVVSVVIPNGAHHIDLMFSDPGDVGYPDIAQARETEVAWMHRWVKETYERCVWIVPFGILPPVHTHTHTQIPPVLPFFSSSFPALP